MPKSYSPKEKAEILKQHFIGKKSISAICKEYRIQPDVFRRWKTAFFENGDLVFRQIPHDGMDYFQNYDLVINWLSEAFRGQTLEVLGIKTEKIRRVCSFKPVEISVSTGVVDVVFEDIYGNAHHVEEQRDMTEDDFYRFASQHFSVAREWKDNITDIILVSGRPYTGRREIQTPTGKYAPVIIDLTERDGPGRFEEIREALNRGDTSVLAELVFLPLYGRKDNPHFVKKVIQFEIDLYKQGRMPVLLVAATLIMANKEIDRTTFQNLWEEIKMLKIFEYAREMIEGEAKEEGKEEGRLEMAREMVLKVLEESLDSIVPAYIADEVMSVSRLDILKGLVKQAVKCKEIDEFEKMLKLANRQATG
ncbi:MAG: transposase [Desulfobacterales bacterium]|nr:transposase [Desulfobacterales bacterium]